MTIRLAPLYIFGIAMCAIVYHLWKIKTIGGYLDEAEEHISYMEYENKRLEIMLHETARAHNGFFTYERRERSNP